jgi:hypothetical protein
LRWQEFHFRTACQDGIKQGEQIGRRAYAQYLQPYREEASLDADAETKGAGDLRIRHHR